ncbi:ABC transporter ATP-binding protein [Candidatus Roizmanbacteria bacterium CG11_big_fil_rev_8_21_14_0_20_35_14]|uniref:ABC transporter ATP-binding protein n=5 Tax=Candidatus Roizmaniibacteriota TaxID=1752723 RepID=A0A2M8F340_9BACT|nr:MAG: ABC transporter ATP-binding protein [Candidatus Roizmanbacteria bacterium CG11_big_fil_rev_8_21_14_0_20_35_14]PJC33689.1 MAG: ABC transporter ATP-binding protein [Candidatus Roizmanbacteria bacterium CG_4_9_14_0_2_um_filter_36_12]
MDILTVKNLTKRFGKFTAVNNISFSLKEGEILGLLGPNGAGKTTTIQMLLGVLTPTQGEVKYFGKNLIDNKEEILEKVNFSSTYTQLPWLLTVEENLKFVSYLYEIKNRGQRIKKIIEAFRLKGLFKEQMKDLSSGEVTRINLAKAFINYPKILLLDEPTASLDPETADYIRKFLIKERNKFNISIIWTSHNMAEVEDVCDRVVFINHGRIIADNTPENLAKTIEICHVELNVPDGLKRTIEICQNKEVVYKLEGRNIVVDLKEKEIPGFLRELMDRGVSYDQISIDKPTLEDYFLQVAPKKSKNED